MLVDALLRQGKFADLMDLVQPSDRNPALESKVRTRSVQWPRVWGDRAKAETLLDEAVKLDPSAARPKMLLARLLSGTKTSEADKLIDDVIAATRARPKPFRSRARCSASWATKGTPSGCSTRR